MFVVASLHFCISCVQAIETVEGILQIGSVYTTRGNYIDDRPSLVHTPATRHQLKMLAAAVQSQQPILLDGDTCSGKTAHVAELAKLCGRRLLVLPMTQDTEVADLVGQWAPSNAMRNMTTWEQQVRDIAHTVLSALFETVLWEQRSRLQDVNSDIFKSVSQLISQVCMAAPDFNSLIALVVQFLTGNATRTNLKELLPQALSLQQRNISHLQNIGGKMVFEFAESQLITALREGWWVLLENVNSAPPEVLERLNPLLEDPPSLSLHERGVVEVLTRGNGIHADFRLFATSNSSRPQSNKLSSAFLNRMIVVSLQPLDQALAKFPAKANSDVKGIHYIVQDLLPDVQG